MLSEVLVIFACVNSTGCNETSDLYFFQNPEIKKQIDKEGRIIRNYVGPGLVDTIGPALFVVGGGTGVVHIRKQLDLQIRRDSAMLTFNWVL